MTISSPYFCTGLLYTLLLCITSLGCTHHPNATTPLTTTTALSENTQTNSTITVDTPKRTFTEQEKAWIGWAKTERAFEMQLQSDLFIFYERTDEIRLYPGKIESITATEETLAEALAKLNAKKDLAVIVVGKSAQHSSPEPKLREKVDALEALLRAQGFKRVVFQLASATGRTIYRE